MRESVCVCACVGVWVCVSTLPVLNRRMQHRGLCMRTVAVANTEGFQDADRLATSSGMLRRQPPSRAVMLHMAMVMGLRGSTVYDFSSSGGISAVSNSSLFIAGAVSLRDFGKHARPT